MCGGGTQAAAACATKLAPATPCASPHNTPALHRTGEDTAASRRGCPPERAGRNTSGPSCLCCCSSGNPPEWLAPQYLPLLHPHLIPRRAQLTTCQSFSSRLCIPLLRGFLPPFSRAPSGFPRPPRPAAVLYPLNSTLPSTPAPSLYPRHASSVTLYQNNRVSAWKKVRAQLISK